MLSMYVVQLKLSNICSLIVTLLALFKILCTSLLEFNHLLDLLICLVQVFQTYVSSVSDVSEVC